MRVIKKKGLLSKSMGHRVFAWIMVAALAFSSCPIAASAEEESVQTEEAEVVNETETESICADFGNVSETVTEDALQYEIAMAKEDVVVTKVCPTIGEDGKVTFWFYEEAGVDYSEVYVKGSWVSDWSQYYYMTEDTENEGVWSVEVALALDKSYEYGIVADGNWKGDPMNPNSNGNSEILRNPTYTSDGSVKIYYYPQGDESVTLLYKTADETEYQSITMTQDSSHAALLSATVTAQGDYEYCFEVNGTQTADQNCVEAKFSISKLPEDDASVMSPVINGTEITFNYYGPTAKSVNLAGEMNGWSSSADALSYNSETGFWSITKTLTPGKYEYKFVVDEKNWTCDSRNQSYSNGNSVFYVAGLVSKTLNVESGQSVTLPAELTLYDTAGNASSVEPTYTVESTYADVLTITDGTITVPSSFSSNYFKVIASYGDYSVDVYIDVIAAIYNYTIYYCDEMHQSTDAASLWIWTDGVNGQQYFFDEAVTLDDGKTWLKAVVSVPYTTLNIIPRAHTDWSWQDADKYFDNSTALDKDAELYLVKGDSNVYTELPDLEAKEGRYVLIEYNRPASDYEGWNIYSWNTGYGSEVTVNFEEVDGKMVAFVPVVDTKESISFCMRRSEEGSAWAEKDGGDHTAVIPLNQTIVKVQFEQGTGVVGNLPYNNGYTTDVANGEITFTYRNDKLYKAYDEDSLEGKVMLVLDGKEFAMSYDEVNERYTYTDKLESGKHAYAYKVDGELIIDKYNEETVEIDGVTYSAYEYVTFDAKLTAKVTPDRIDYNDNAVLALSIDAGEQSDAIVITEAYADLSALGLSANFKIDASLMAGTIAVKDSIGAGEKQIPVTVKDQYGNIYKTTAKVTVAPRQTKADDFDWDEAVIYFAVTDRFFDGNATNNDAYGTGTYNPEAGSMYHGGDLAGLEAKLDYLQELGVNTIWITPIVENIEDVLPCDGHEGQNSAGYHGYWANDFTKLNQHLGTEEELSSLISAMHARGMKLMVDVVLNHAGYGAEDNFNNTYLEDTKMLRDKDTTISGDEQKDGLSGLPDFVTENPEVRELLIEWQTAWVSKYDIDYFRVDTVKHVEDTTWKAFKNALTYVDPDFKMIGEHAGSGALSNAGQLGTGQMDSLLDFDFNDKALAFVNGELGNVESFLENRNRVIDNTATVGSFLGSHDEDGLMYRMMQGTQNGGLGFDEAKAYDLMKVAAALQMTAKGQPVIYYGEELGQTGANNWPYQDNRYDLDWSIANDTNDMLVHYETVLDIRNEYSEVFAKGTRSTMKLDESNGVLVVSRAYADESLYVGFNVNQSAAKEVTLALTAGKNYVDLYSGKTFTANDNGEVVVTIPAAADGGTVILKEGKAQVEKPSAEDKPSVDNKPSAGGNAESKPSPEAKSVVVTKSAKKIEPAYIKMDGKVVTGWQNVIREALKDAEANRVPLAGSVDTAAQALIVDLMLGENTIKTIPASVVKEMAVSGASFRFHYGKDAAIAITSATLTEVAGSLDLDILVEKNIDFGQNFKSVVLNPQKDTIFGVKLAAAVLLGEEYAGKPAYIYHKNLFTQETELITSCIVEKNGTIAVSGVDYTDLIILY